METQKLYDDLISLINEQIENNALPSRLKEVIFKPDMRLNDLGLDSIALVALQTSLMDMTDSFLPDSLFSDNPSLWEIAQRISDSSET
jgi:acyl carrier protein